VLFRSTRSTYRIASLNKFIANFTTFVQFVSLLYEVKQTIAIGERESWNIRAYGSDSYSFLRSKRLHGPHDLVECITIPTHSVRSNECNDLAQITWLALVWQTPRPRVLWNQCEKALFASISPSIAHSGWSLCVDGCMVEQYELTIEVLLQTQSRYLRQH